MNEKLPNQVQEFSAENFPNGSLAKVAKSHTNLSNFVTDTNSLIGEIFEELPFGRFARPNTSSRGKNSQI